MKYYVYSLFDRLISAYGQPQFSLNDGPTMIETYRRMIVSQKDVEKIDQVKDLQLCLLGTFDDTTGTFDAVKGLPEVLCNLAQFVPVVKEAPKDVRKESQV